MRGRNTERERYVRRVKPKASSRVAGWVTARLRPAVAWPDEKWPGSRRRWAAAGCGDAWRNQRDFRRPGTGFAACWRPAPPRTDPVAGWTSIGSTTTSPGHIAPVRAHHTRWWTPHCAAKTDDDFTDNADDDRYETGPRRWNDRRRTDAVRTNTTVIVSYLGNADGRGEDHYHRLPHSRPWRMEGTHHGRDTDFRGREPVFGVGANERAAVRALVWK